MHAALVRLQGAPDPGLGFAKPGGIIVACCALGGAPARAEHAAAGCSWRARVRRPNGCAVTTPALAEAAGSSGESGGGPEGAAGVSA